MSSEITICTVVTNEPSRQPDYLYYRPEEQMSMMDHECLNDFLSWVAYHQDSKPIENLSCPFTGCAEKDFRDFETYLQHVFACQYLLAGKHRCSNCKREACLVPSNVKAHTFGKDSKLGDTFTSFLRQFCHQDSLDLRYELSTDAEVPAIRELYTDAKNSEFNTDAGVHERQASAYELEVAVPELCTMDRGSFASLPREYSASSTKPSESVGVSHVVSLQNEIPLWKTHRPELHGGLDTSLVSELSGTRSYIDPSGGLEGESWYDDGGYDAETASIASQSTQRLSSACDSRRSAMASPEPLPFNGAKSHSHHDYSASKDAGTDTRNNDSDQCWSKPSGTGGWSAKQHSPMPIDSDLTIMRSSSRSGSTTPASRRRTDLKLHIPPSPSETVEGAQSHKETAPKALAFSLPVVYNKTCLVDDISQIVKSLEDLWMQKLKTSPELSAITFQVDSSATLLTGLMFLKRFFISNLTAPTTTKELFQFIHIAFACALKSFSEDGWYPWQALYQDMLRWSWNITELEDRNLYVQIVEYLWSSLKNVQPYADAHICNEVDMHLHTSEDVGRSRINKVEVEGAFSNQRESISSLEAYDRLVLLSQLEGGIMIRSCTRFLDGMWPVLYVHPAKLRHRIL